MSSAFTKQQLQKNIALIVAQTELFPDSIVKQTQFLDQGELEKLTIQLYSAQKVLKNLKPEETALLDKSLKRYFDGKKRIYQKTQQAWLIHQEAKNEAQESLFEACLLAEL